MKKYFFVLTLCSMNLAVVPGAEAQRISIVVNRGSYATVVAAASDEANVKWNDGQDEDDTICSECFAAMELQHYLGKIIGASVDEPIPMLDDEAISTQGNIILIGNLQSNQVIKAWSKKLAVDENTFAGLGPEGYILKTIEDGPGNQQILVIGGRSRIGTLYGVYGLLYRLGVRWLSPGEIGEEVPPMALESLPYLDVVDKPAFCLRGFHAWEYRGDPDFFNWMARNRMNCWCIENKDHPGLRKRGIQMIVPNGHALQSRFIGPDKDYPYNHPAFTSDEEFSPDPYPLSTAYAGDANEDGRLSYSEAHPEWFGLHGGTRSFHMYDDFGDNFCSSNPYACDELMKKIVTELAEGQWQDADSINFWTLDGGRWCECESCQALGTPTDKTLLLVHRLCLEMKRARQEGRLHRDVSIFFTIYLETIQPPTRPLPDDFDYQCCIGTYYPINRCYVHSLTDPACTETNVSFVSHLKGWTTDPPRYYRGQLLIGEYYNVSGFKCLPILFHRTMASDIPYYYDLGARYMDYMHVTTKNWGTLSLTNYQFARMLWDPYLDSQALRKDYLAKRYGPAADRMYDLYQKLDTALCNANQLKYRLPYLLNQDAENLFPDKHMKYEATHFDTDDGPDLVEMVQAIDEGLAILAQVQAEDLPGRIQARLAEDGGPLQYAAHTLHFYDVLVRMTRSIHAGQRDEAAQWLPEMKRLGELLENDTESTKWSSSHANADNALVASQADGAYHRFLEELEPLPETYVRDLNRDKPLIITGSEFRGGGMNLHGKGIWLHDTVYSEQGNYLYSKSAGYDRMKIGVWIPSIPDVPLTFQLVGMSCPVQGESDVPFRILWDHQELFSGRGGYPEGKLTSHSFEVPVEKLQAGLHILQIENITLGGQLGNRPWFGVDRVEFHTSRAVRSADIRPDAAVVPADTEGLDYTIKLETVLKTPSDEYWWFHPRVAAVPGMGEKSAPRIVMSMQKELILSDFYSGLYVLSTNDRGASWTEPDERAELAWRKLDGGITLSVADPTPGWHVPTGKLLIFGCTVHYQNGHQISPQPGVTSYTIHDPIAGTWSPWQEIRMPDREDFFCSRSACSQWLTEPDGTLLIPIYFSRESAVASVAVMRCSFDGKMVRYLELGNEMKLNVPQSLCEPSITFFQGRYYLTIRNEEKGYVTVSDDGLHFASIKPWTFDDGGDLGSYNTQQHWVTHSDALFLSYTRRGADNDHIPRHRAPLFIAQVDAETLCVIRRTERLLIPENNAMLGNFGAAAIDEKESWVTVGEYVLTQPKREASVFAARIIWSKPNCLANHVR